MFPSLKKKSIVYIVWSSKLPHHIAFADAVMCILLKFTLHASKVPLQLTRLVDVMTPPFPYRDLGLNSLVTLPAGLFRGTPELQTL